ncbi:MAG: hypothetical protein P4N60_00960, partial [Verrucomicrobiae bacterium]|nr:hypothetical protein [Verrucomicrobiae bacterium]
MSWENSRIRSQADTLSSPKPSADFAATKYRAVSHVANVSVIGSFAAPAKAAASAPTRFISVPASCN